MIEEIWKDIPGYEGMYQASTLGRIRSVDRIVMKRHPSGRMVEGRFKGKVLKLTPTPYGYLCCNVCREGEKPHREQAHRLVAMTFVDGYFEGADVNHIDENKQNNRVENLEWCTRKQNINHGTHNERATAWMEETKRPVLKLSLSGEVLERFGSVREAARAVNANHDHIAGCCEGRYGHKTCKGYRWRYE